MPSESIIRDVLVRVDPAELDIAFRRWDESLAIDGKTMCHAIDDEGHQTHIMSTVGHDSHRGHTQKK
ncbi:MAG: transposase family protein [Gammaproteobacteria bacterium]|nr:transposase family protein [Gammaproteobacteria bacterium]